MTDKHQQWAIESCRGYARWREFGKTRPMIRHEKDPEKPWEGQPLDPKVEAELDATAARNRDLDEHDHALVCRELASFVGNQSHLFLLDDLLFHCFREGQHGKLEELVRSFEVRTPFETIPVRLGEIGSSAAALHHLRRFVWHLARVKAAGEGAAEESA